MRAPRDPLSHGPRPPAWTPTVEAPARPDLSGRYAQGGALHGASPASAAGGASQVLPFRRRTGLPVRRRSRLAAFVRPFLMAVVIVGVPASALWWSATSPAFALTDLEIHGSERVSAEWMRGQLADLVGQNLVWLPLDRVEHILSGHPWIAGVEVTKELPDRLRVVVVERRPVAILDETRDGVRTSFWIDADGSLIAPRAQAAGATAGGAESSGEVAGGSDAAFLQLHWDGASEVPADRRREVLAAALGAARQATEAAPALGGAVDSVTVLGDEDFRLEGAALPFPLLVRFYDDGQRSEIASRLRRLEELLPEIRSEMGTRLAEPASVDLRFRHRIVVRPAVAETAVGHERGA